jgi:hypothetical protein
VLPACANKEGVLPNPCRYAMDKIAKAEEAAKKPAEAEPALASATPKA